MSLIGGISVFGVAGVIVGPVTLSLFLASARIYEREREQDLADLTSDEKIAKVPKPAMMTTPTAAKSPAPLTTDSTSAQLIATRAIQEPQRRKMHRAFLGSDPAVAGANRRLLLGLPKIRLLPDGSTRELRLLERD